jgi:N-acetylmuramoyl-L-alanine amidase
MSKAARFDRRNLFMSSIAPNIDNPPPESKLRRRLHACLAVALVVPWFTGCESGMKVKDTTRTFRTVVIDAGHGGHDTGARSRGGGLEKHAALDTVLRLDPKLRAAGFNTVLTRRSDYFIPLGERTRVSNRQENAIFVSVHYNHARNRSAHGVETFYRSRPSRKIAASIQDAICRLPGVASRGVKTANFWVLRRNEYPAVLVEGGFFSNPREAKRCASPAYREAVADAIARAIIGVRGPFQTDTPPALAPESAGLAATPAAGIPATAGNSPPPASR